MRNDHKYVLEESLIEYFNGDKRTAQEAMRNYYVGSYHDKEDFAECYFDERTFSKTEDMKKIKKGMNWVKYADELLDEDFFNIDLNNVTYIFERF